MADLSLTFGRWFDFSIMARLSYSIPPNPDPMAGTSNERRVQAREYVDRQFRDPKNASPPRRARAA